MSTVKRLPLSMFTQFYRHGHGTPLTDLRPVQSPRQNFPDLESGCCSQVKYTCYHTLVEKENPRPRLASEATRLLAQEGILS